MSSAEFSVYEVKNSLEKVLFLLVEKIYAADKSCLVYSSMDDRLKSYDQSLWTFKKISFIPHALKGDLYQERNKILLSGDQEGHGKAWDNVILLDNYSAYKDFKVSEKVMFLVHETESFAKDGLFSALNGVNFKFFRERKDSTWEKVDC